MNIVDKFFNENYNEIIKIGRRIVKRREEGQEVAAFCIEKFLQHKRRDELIEKGEALLFLSGMIYRSYHFPTSQYSRQKNQRPGSSQTGTWLDDDPFNIYELYDSTIAKWGEEDDEPEFFQIADEEYDTETDLKIEAIQGIMEDMESDTIEQWFRVKLFQMWLKKPNYSELSRITNIPRTSISQAVNECKEYIKQRIEQHGISD